MNRYESIILELLSRVQTLEEQVKYLQEQLNETTQLPVSEESSETKITKTVARKYVIDIIEAKNPKVKVRVGRRTDIGDLILTTSVKDINAKYYYSKSHEDDFISGWHVVKQSDIIEPQIDTYIFTVSYTDNSFHNFVFTQKELREFVKGKVVDSGNAYHFYFRITSNGQIIEVRDTVIDASKYYERWEFFTTL